MILLYAILAAFILLAGVGLGMVIAYGLRGGDSDE